MRATQGDSAIRRVVSCFLLLREPTLVAVFHRQDTMPTYPSHWAAISGSIEQNETPWDTVQRELGEETNLLDLISLADGSCRVEQGLYLDVVLPVQSRDHPRLDNAQEVTTMSQLPGPRIIRVYPFAIAVPDHVKNRLQLRGTEHDAFEWKTLIDLERLQPVVPALQAAFHHATRGEYNRAVTWAIRSWSSDRVSGAATMARNAVTLVSQYDADPTVMKMLRPSMVALTNVLGVLENGQMSPHEMIEALEIEGKRAVNLAVERLSERIQQCRQASGVDRPFVIATISRSSTIVAVLKSLITKHRLIHVICSESTPGEEGVLMAQHLCGVPCLPDSVVREMVLQGTVDLVLVGCDCATEHHVVNKVGTGDLARAGAQSGICKVLCCTDRWKIWEDVFLPPLESIFEAVPRSLFDEVIIPESLRNA